MPEREVDRTLRADVFAAATYATVLFSANVAYWTTPTSDYYLRGEGRSALLAVLAAEALVAVLAYGVIRAARRSGVVRLAAACVALPATAVALNRLRVALGLPLPWLDSSRFALLACAVALVLARGRIVRVARVLHTGFRWGVALVVVSLGTLLQALAFPPRVAPETGGGPRTSKPMIVWAIFDELDEGWLFDHRPTDLRLPAFDRLAAESLVGRNVKRPGPETLVSLPALTVGRELATSVVASRSDMSLEFVDGGRTLWSKADTVFDAMRRLGRVPAIDGYYHNYPGVFGGRVHQARTSIYPVTGFLGMLEYQFLLLVPYASREGVVMRLGMASIGNREAAVQHRERLDAQAASLERILRARSADFVFFHCRVPHAPYIRDYRTGRRGLTETPEGYFGNLQLADEILARLVGTLRETGEWDRATLLVTSDHNLRYPLRGMPLNELVPLILKLPGQSKAMRLDRPVRAVDERWLLEAVAEGRVTTPGEAAALLADRATNLRPPP